MKILITGGAGFIGSHVADRFAVEGHDVHVLDNLVSGSVDNVRPGVPFHRLDIRDEAVGTLFEAERFEVLVHLAAQLDVRRSVADPVFDADVNILGLLRLLEAGRKNGLRRVIFSSTGGAIYGEPDYVPQDEMHPLRPVSPYGISKLAGEKYLAFYEKTYGIAAVNLRYANVYGPRQSAHGEAGVVAIFASQLLAGKAPVIFGDGRQTRDYVHVADVVEANYLTLRDEASGTYNVGTGVETSVRALFDLMRSHSAPRIEARHAPPRAGEQRRSVLDFDRIRQHLGWEPGIPLPVGLQKTIDWFESRTAGTP